MTRENLPAPDKDMKIKNVSCTQFAGIRDKSVSFRDGLNLLYGKNESGKSTLVNLISRTLFQNPKLNGRTDKEFCELYFPSAKRNAAFVGDFADGQVTLSSDSGEYTVSKQWGKQPFMRLSAPDGIISDPAAADAVLRQVLLYGEGVYSDLLFSSQKNAAISLETLLDAAKSTDAKKEISGAVTRAFAESDGIPVDAVEAAIHEKIDAIAGKHWDCERSQPQKKAGRWANGLGEILRAYYELEDAENALDRLNTLESECDEALSGYEKADQKAASAQEQYRNFQVFAAKVSVMNERKKRLASLQQQQIKLASAAEKWPKLVLDIAQGKALLEEAENRRIFDQFEKAKQAHAALQAVQTAMADTVCPDADGLEEAKKKIRETEKLEGLLCGMNLSAKISVFGENEATITSMRTGETVTPENGAFTVREAVRIALPGVMELSLAPGEIDIDSVNDRLAGLKGETADFLEKYAAESIGELEERVMKLEKLKIEESGLKMKLKILLVDESYESLEQSAGKLGKVRTQEEIDTDIRLLVGNTELSRFVAACETTVNAFEEEFGSEDSLKEQTDSLSAEIVSLRQALSLPQDIPSEYLAVQDADAYLQKLEASLALLQGEREEALKNKTAAVERLEAYRDNTGDEIPERLEKARARFEEQKTLLADWQNILAVFYECKNRLNENPMEELATRFADYLAVISDGKITSEFPQPDRLDMTVFSSDRLLSYGRLSEGSKETVSLAFRLAVLDYLFPDGGGVIVFDDPFSDMDAARREQACGLIKKCAQMHQVIFLTCHEEYETLLATKAVCME